MKPSPLRLPVAVAASILLLAVGPASADMPLASGVARAGFDATVRPQDDFFRAVNGTWLKTTEIPGDKSRIGSFISLRDRSEAQLHGLIDEAVRTHDTPDAQRIGDLYESFMDEAQVEKAGLGPLTTELATIDAMASVRELGAEFGRMDRLGAAVPFDMSISLDARDASHYIPVLNQSGLLLPDRDYYLVAADPKFAQARSAEVAYLTKLLELSGAAADAAPRAQAVLDLETALARGQMDPRREPRPGQGLQQGRRSARLGDARRRLRLAGLSRLQSGSPERRATSSSASPPTCPSSRRSWRPRRCPSGRRTCAPTC